MLSDTLTLPCGQVLPNRFMKSALSEQLGDKRRNPSTKLIEASRRWSEGGTGLIVSGNVMIDREHLGEFGNVVLDGQSDLSRFRTWAQAGTEYGTQLWMQLNHPGKQIPAFLHAEPLAPSAVPLGKGLEAGFNCPRAMTNDEVEATIRQFATAAGLAKQAGFTGVQIHGAHGYLVSQFLSPVANVRQDKWGGSPENRMRFVLEVLKAIRAEVGPDYPVGIKLNSADFQRGGYGPDESMNVVRALDAAGIDLIEISGGTYETAAMMGAGADKRKASTVAREAYFLSYAEDVRSLVRVPLAVTGGFRSAKGMQDAVDSGAMDVVGLGRPLIMDPDLPKKVQTDPDYEIDVGSPATGNRTIDRIFSIGLVWYELQIHRLGRGRLPKPGLSAWRAAAFAFRTYGRAGLRKRRA